MNMFKKNGGFTLVELIVVIAILAILAGVAVPAYSGYISKANEAADYTMLDGVKTAAVFAAIEADPDATVTEIVVTFGDNTVTVKTDADTTGTGYNVSEYTTVGASKSGATTATWTAADAEWDLE
ncbi:MAG: prepilin-type N-terminal cleavage/methylation domain-containing protein [Oscillospiraceae bacterium]|nr:prepilin-type N-terminal cleavage/methylation domain-containing protein [Oscillospiraceae bacterium]